MTCYLRESITAALAEPFAVSVSAGNDLSTYGTRISSSGRVNLQAGGAANYYAVYDQVNNRDDSNETFKFLFIPLWSSNSTSSYNTTTPLVTRLQSEAELVSNSGGNQLLQGTQVSAGGGYAFNGGVGEKARADARIILEGVVSTVQQSRTAKSDAVVWQSTSDSGSNTQTLALPTFAGGGTFSAPGGLSVQIPEGDFKTQVQTLSQQPGMGYLNDLAARKDVDWQRVKLANDQWNYSQSGLTPAGAALIGLAVAMATGGAGAGLVGTTTTTVTTVGGVTTTTAITTLGSTTLAVNGVATVAGTMANAAFTSLAAQASITLINNKGDIGKTLKDLGNSQTVKNMIISAGVAGVATYTADWGRTLTPNGNSIVTDWSKRSQAYLINTAAKGVLSGSKSSGDWWTVAGLGLAGEAYQYWVGRGADVRPGVDRDNPKFETVKEGGLFRVPIVTVNDVIREGNNIGFNENPCLSFTGICQGMPISNGLNTLPGFNAFATLHDSWGEWLANGKNWNLATNLGGMPPALVVTYASLLDQYRYINSRRK